MIPKHASDDALLVRILGRSRSLFADDISDRAGRLADSIADRRLLIVGAGGSIGSAFVKQLVQFRPAALHLVDINENALVELVRDLRSSPLVLPTDFRTVSIDFGASEFARFAKDRGSYDALFNFAAMKHVRSERDVYSLLRMIEVNVESLKRCLDGAGRPGFARVFSVSTDKSVRPANLMGATKNLMERVLFKEGTTAVATTARFANVAFSAGSLLEGFEHRLRKRQPIAAPTDVQRYFMSHQEAGELCLLAGFLGEHRQVFFPKMRSAENLKSFSDIAAAFLRHHGYEPQVCASEHEAIAAMGTSRDKWPCYFSASGTTGEKSVEEFHREIDIVDVETYRAVATTREAPADPAVIEGFLAEIARIRRAPRWSKADVVAAIRSAVPELVHCELDRNLDQKM